MPYPDPVKNAACKKLYAQTHKEKIAASTKKWAQKNAPKVLAKVKRWQAANPEKTKKSIRKWRDNNAEHVASYEKDYRAKKSQEILLKNAKRRALKANAPINDLTKDQWEAIKAHFNHRCAYCHRKMKRLSQDHITPLAKGGSHTLSNVVPACRSCNSRKGTRAPLCPIQPLLLV